MRVLGKGRIFLAFLKLSLESRVLGQELATLFFHVWHTNPELVGRLHHLVEESPIYQRSRCRRFEHPCGQASVRLVHVDYHATCRCGEGFHLSGVFGLHYRDTAFALTRRESSLGVSVGFHFHLLRFGKAGVLDVVQVEKVDYIGPLWHEDVCLRQLYGRSWLVRCNQRATEGDRLVVVMAHPVGSREVALHGVACPTQVVHPNAILVYRLVSQLHRLLSVGR